MNRQHEEEIMAFWKENAVYEKVKANVKGKKKFYFLDGPPYATGAIHIGTAWNKILKDVYIRFWRMSGFDVWDQPGYDTHGIPIENKVEKELQLRAKHDIERLGIERFILACRKFATEHIGTMNEQFANLGVWMDFDNPYLTLSNEYIEGAWHTFKVGYDKGLLYHSSYSVHVCPHCETAVAYNEIEYTKLTDPSVFVKFPVAGKENEFLVIWTTTPWTLPSNTGIMAHPKADYVRVNVDSQTLILAKQLVESLMKKIGVSSYTVLETIKGKNLEGMKYVHPLTDLFPFLKSLGNAHRVVLSEQYVSLEEGTGLVHTAPGHGKEDYVVGLENKLPAVNPLKMNGTFNEECGEFSGMFAKHADRKIIDILKERGLLLLEEKVTHDYPQCWRCSSPLLQMAVPQWFFRVTAIRDKLLKANKKVAWNPPWAQQRFQNWLENLGDWPISRQRYWGIPLPIWMCGECKSVKVVGSSDELPDAPKDLHRPYIDKVVFDCACGSVMRRISDVLDVWFDSGLAAWASLGYPKHRETFERLFPSDFQTEGPDQFRGWWNSEIITSMITFDKTPFKSILLHGFVLDAHGNKMSKSKGNIVQPEDVIEKYGRDVLRLYLVSSAPWEDFYFKWVDAETTAKSFTVIENTFNFVKSYAVPIAKPKTLAPADKWILSRLNSLIAQATADCKSYNAHRAATAVHDFLLNDFSRLYIKLVRDRVWPAYDGKDKDAAMYTLFTVSHKSAALLAPFCPFLAEHVYQHVLKPLGAELDSVHMEKFPKFDKKMVDKELEAQMELAKAVTEAVNALRQEHKIKLRWPLGKVVVSAEVSEEMKDIIKFMCNVKSVETGSGAPFPSREFAGGKVYLDTTITGELKTEALLREVVRRVQDMRKKAGMVVSDRIVLTLEQCDELKPFSEQLRRDVGADQVHYGSAQGEKLEFEGRTVGIAVEKLS
ncbi:MAG: isoleucine--tRNA ligase [Candidatus Aenigmarchaeota archaeon]|nr:isoleucine--tRNA ligase [Candidatus Aenigmarchaeota archaeon]